MASIRSAAVAVLCSALLYSSVSAQAPGTSLPDFGVKAADMDATFAKSKDSLVAALDAVAAVPDDQRDFNNSVAAVETAFADFSEAMTPLTFLSQVSTERAVREKALGLEKASNQLVIDMRSREDVYRAVKAFADKKPKLEGEDAKLLDDLLKNFHRNGLDLPSKQRDQLKALQKRLSDLELDFADNIKEDNAALEATPASLEGVPADFLKGLPVGEGGKVRIPLDYPGYQTIMEGAKSADLRRQAEFLFNNKASTKNIAILKETLAKRHEVARMLGYDSYAAYMLDHRRTAKTPKRVFAFLDRLTKLLGPAAKTDLKSLLELKAKDDPKAGRIENWDVTGLIGQQIGYYPARYMQAKYDVDPEQVRPYFPMDRVVSETFKLLEQLLGVKFQRAEVKSWHPDVQAYQIHDAASGELLAWFFLDMYPREGKYNHMACFDIVRGRAMPGGGYRVPVSAMVGNFSKPSADKPSLLRHDEVETFYHEFGHVLHQSLTRAKYISFSGSNTALDFVEAPSQMMESFIWRPEVLQRISGHYQDPSKKLPKELLDRMLAARNALSGLQSLRLVSLATTDMEFHGPSVPKDTGAELSKVFTRTGYLTPTPGTHFEARFGHILGGYGAGYYGYLWADVFAHEIFSRFEKEGVLNPAVGMDYRKKILERGSSVDEEQSLREFLGREPNEKAFLDSLGISSEQK